MDKNQKVLEADSIWLEYDGRKILQNIYLKAETGKVTGLLGRNGVGKSSLLRIIFGTLPAQSQSVRINGAYVAEPYKQHGLLRYLPQHRFAPNLSLKTLCSCYDVLLEQMVAYFPELGEHTREKINSLSGGKVRLIETMLVLLSPVSFVILDEPFTHLSPVVTETLMQVITDQKAHKGILVCDHLYHQVLAISDAAYLMVPVGRTILLTDPLTELSAYGYTL
ncbi:ATP-binding cassette domain-containing protein [Dyadobacter sandarakinus]|uniref:ATP-binding cassette domain-containing protein n=1 Tax=Dyadobacter sandarakinus TaxID=2747268 RepID=A0ABX7IBJ4_9BACT|nr:ATP-binding cassette domain-containing protein [Dyadobacter sandarakinus]QRR02902.1 ATP-binding cassette domain-containing protein [Dyadobacter sandarakinus]